MNNKIVQHMRDESFCNSTWILNVYHFLDDKRLLAEHLTRSRDPIHLGRVGIAKFVSTLRYWIYYREKCESQHSEYSQNHRQHPTPPPRAAVS